MVTDEQTRVRALQGDVRVWNRGNATDWAPVTAGSSATLRTGAPLQARTFDINKVEPGDIVWAQEFDAYFKSGANIEGVLLTQREDQRLATIIQSIPVDPWYQEHSFKPDEWISLELYSRPAKKGVPIRSVAIWGERTGTINLDRVLIRRAR